ncbi:serine hydrolase domain-containing protein [Pseudacidobacterium ailaaui]|jgi:CubicO group peptidase (beta-lactamase class C family)|uniref:serine hydrolase domain-containing protein n=1 Tax=Pseudacidobacterium ailaaui TaxID=1382359 RepID=UPI0005D19B65|nr:serine hydrolase domain-containing protein [Pseudacidobacterium ailaaui]
MRFLGMAVFPLVLLLPVTPPTPSAVPAKSPTSPAQDGAGANLPSITPSAAHALEPADLETFFDGILPLQLERSDIAGASVLVMKDGRVLLLKGYGYADLKTKRPVDPATTMFRLASISKLFTWTAIMQLEEQGRLNLDTDINQYLDFRIRPAFGRPITLRHLMTHTAGFEETDRDLITVHPAKDIPLRQYLIANQPMRIFPPGEVPAYSNYGVGLASYIVQRLSGEPFEQYVQEHIFAPLEMTHSTFVQPPPQELAPYVSTGYHENTERPPVGFEVVHPAGAGGLSSTAADMGRFGMAFLNGGELDGHRILKPDTVTAMWTPQYRASDQMPPICMGFYQMWRNGLHWIGHEGDLVAFHSLFFIEPVNRLVLFVSYNSAGGADKPRPEIINLFSDRYFPSHEKQAFANLPLAQRKAVAGTYLTTRREDSTGFRLMNLWSQRKASVDKDGVLQIQDIKDLRGHPVKWKPLSPDLWQEIDGQRRLFTIRNDQGAIVRLAFDFPGVQMQRVPWCENAELVLTVVEACLAVLLAVVVASLLRLWRRLFLRKRGLPAPQPGTRWLPLSSRAAAWTWSGLLLALFSVIVSADDMMPPTSAWDKYFYLVHAVTMLAIFFSLLAAVAGIRIWKAADVRSITKIKYSVVAIACMVLSVFALQWHLLGLAARF